MSCVAQPDLTRAYEALRGWLTGCAYDTWWQQGADQVHGGFFERLNPDASPTHDSRRARLHPRQIFCYANAGQLGWSGPARVAVYHGLNFFLRHYRREDGLYRSCVAQDGTSVNDAAVLYDQAFALLGLAAAYSLTGELSTRAAACELHELLIAKFGRPGGGFEESETPSEPLTSNSHMHLLEASLEWYALEKEARWLQLAAQMVDLALTYWIEPRGGAIREFFAADWRPASQQGRRAEPGHQYEWAWLLLRYAGYAHDLRVTPAALRLIAFGEEYGVDARRRVAINACLDDGTALDRDARLWPQAERIKAGCRAGEVTGEQRYFDIAREATLALMGYLETPVRGLWRDRLQMDGHFTAEPAPASSFYHIVCAAAELRRVCHRVG